MKAYRRVNTTSRIELVRLILHVPRDLVDYMISYSTGFELRPRNSQLYKDDRKGEHSQSVAPSIRLVSARGSYVMLVGWSDALETDGAPPSESSE
jgi:hypothetical protein